MKKLALYIIIPSIILIALMWIFSPFLITESRTHKRTVFIPAYFKEKSKRLDTLHINSFVKRKKIFDKVEEVDSVYYPKKNNEKVLVIKDTVPKLDSCIQESPLLFAMAAAPETTKVKKVYKQEMVVNEKVVKTIVDTVYVEKIIVKQIAVIKKEEKEIKSTSVQEIITWAVGIMNTLLAMFVTLKKVFGRKKIVEEIDEG